MSPWRRPRVEACVTGLDEAVRCVAWGADRLELCRDLETGGLTPSPDITAQVCAAVSVPVFAMVRPEPGAFTADARGVATMLREIEALRRGGLAGLVAGLLTSDGQVDVAAMTAVCAAAAPLEVTFHRAFDELLEPDLALEQLAAIGVTRVLTAGGRGSAWEGRRTLARWTRTEGLRPRILAAGRIRGDHVVDLVKCTGVEEIHARASGIREVCAALPPSVP